MRGDGFAAGPHGDGSMIGVHMPNVVPEIQKAFVAHTLAKPNDSRAAGVGFGGDLGEGTIPDLIEILRNVGSGAVLAAGQRGQQKLQFGVEHI